MQTINSMKIVYIAQSLIPSRTANSIHIMKMCHAFAQNGHDVVLQNLSEQNENQVSSDDSHLYSLYSVKKIFDIKNKAILAIRGSRIRYLVSTLFTLVSLCKEMRRCNADLVYGRSLVGCFAAALVGKDVIFESHFPVWHSFLERLMFQMLLRQPHFKKLVVISEALKKAYVSRYPQLQFSKILVAHDGADLCDTHARHESWCGGKERLQVGYVGHLYKGKGIEVIAAVAKEMPEVDFHIIGGLEKDITEWKNKISSENVFFHGFVPQNKLSPYINSLDVCLLPNQLVVSGYGGKDKRVKNIGSFTSPLKMFEYMAHKRAIVASDLPVLREVLNDDCAVLVGASDIAAWCGAIHIMTDAGLRQRLSENAYNLLRDKYTWQKRAEFIINSLAAQYNECAP